MTLLNWIFWIVLAAAVIVFVCFYLKSRKKGKESAETPAEIPTSEEE